MKYKRITAVLLAGALMISGCFGKEPSLSETESATEPVSETTAETSGETEVSETSETTGEYDGITDVTPPVVLSSNSSVSLTVGDIFDPNKYISYIDDYDRTPRLTMESEVDTAVPGVYETAMIITDSSGNVSTNPITVRVKREGETSTPTPTPIGFVPSPTPTPAPSHLDFDEFVSRYQADGLEFGIDVSKWQGDVDYNAVKRAGATFVIIRAGVYYEGEFNFDSKFEQNLRNAKAAGLKVGLYFFTPVTSEEILIENITEICEALNGQELELPIAYDMENWNRFQQYRINLQDLNGYFRSFCDVCESYGYKGMLYNSKNKLESVWDADGQPVWLAHYTRETSYEGDFFMWQVNNTGRIAGIDGDVDLNILYVDRYNG